MQKRAHARTTPTFICFFCARAERVINRHGGAYCPKSLFIYARSAARERSEADFMLCALGYKSSAAFHFIHTKSAILLCHLILFVYCRSSSPRPWEEKIVPSLEQEREKEPLLVYLSANCFQSIVSRAGGGIWMRRDENLLSYYHTSERRKSVFIISIALPFNQISISSPPRRNFHARR
jgi:hypothetical protein